MERLGLGVGKMQAAWGRAGQGGGGGNAAEAPQQPPPTPVSYAEERGRRILYQDPQLHLLVRPGPSKELLAGRHPMLAPSRHPVIP